METPEKMKEEKELTDTNTEDAILEVLSKLDPATPPPLEAIIRFTQSTTAPRLVHWLARYFIERVTAGVSYDIRMLERFILRPLEQISEGISADQAFGLKPMKGKYSRADTHDRDVSFAVLVADKRRKGLVWEDAVGDVAEAFGIKPRTVERAYDRYREGVDDLPTEILHEMAERILPTS